MKDRLIGFLKTYCLFICIFALQKPFFMLFYRSLYEAILVMFCFFKNSWVEGGTRTHDIQNHNLTL